MVSFPFHLLNNSGAMNVRPKNYEWTEFYDLMIDLYQHAHSKRAMFNRMKATPAGTPKLMNLARSVSYEGWGRIKYFKEIRRRLDEDIPFRSFFEGETDVLPTFYRDRIKKDMGPLWDWLPEGSISHDPYAYLNSEPVAERAVTVSA
jgi:hypothetical protein